MKKLYGVMALLILSIPRGAYADFEDFWERLRERPRRTISRNFVDYERNGSAQVEPLAPEAEVAADLAAFHAFHSSSPTILRAAHLGRIIAKGGSLLGNTHKNKKLRDHTKDKKGNVLLTTGAQTLSMGANVYHTVVHDVPESGKLMSNAVALAKRNTALSEMAQQNYSREKIWQWALAVAQYFIAIRERAAMNDTRNQDASVYNRGLFGAARNLLRLWQQSRLSKYYRKNLEYTLHPEKEQAAIQAQLDRAERKRLLWEERKEKLGALPGNVWHFLKEKGIDPLGRFGEKEWRHIASLVTNFFKK